MKLKLIGGVMLLLLLACSSCSTCSAERSGQLHEQYNKLKVYVDSLKTADDIEAVTFDTDVIQ